MAEITNKGRELALLLAPSIGTNHTIQETCSLLTRQATTYARIQEELCSGPRSRWEGNYYLEGWAVECTRYAGEKHRRTGRNAGLPFKAGSEFTKAEAERYAATIDPSRKPRIYNRESRYLEEWQAALEKREAQVEARLRVLASLLPRVTPQNADFPVQIGIVISGDPRGSTVKLAMPDGRYDDMGQDGLCVPGS